MNPWDRQVGESDIAYSAFKTYLDMEGRTLIAVAEKCTKNANLIRRWAAKFNWRERADAYEASAREEAFKRISKKYARAMERQWNDCEEFQIMAAQAMREKDLQKVSPKTLNEIYHASAQRQMDIADRIGATGAVDSQLTINIKEVDDSP